MRKAVIPIRGFVSTATSDWPPVDPDCVLRRYIETTRNSSVGSPPSLVTLPHHTWLSLALLLPKMLHSSCLTSCHIFLPLPMPRAAAGRGKTATANAARAPSLARSLTSSSDRNPDTFPWSCLRARASPTVAPWHVLRVPNGERTRHAPLSPTFSNSRGPLGSHNPIPDAGGVLGPAPIHSFLISSPTPSARVRPP